MSAASGRGASGKARDVGHDRERRAENARRLCADAREAVRQRQGTGARVRVAFDVVYTKGGGSRVLRVKHAAPSAGRSSRRIDQWQVRPRNRGSGSGITAVCFESGELVEDEHLTAAPGSSPCTGCRFLSCRRPRRKAPAPPRRGRIVRAKQRRRGVRVGVRGEEEEEGAPDRHGEQNVRETDISKGGGSERKQRRSQADERARRRDESESLDAS